MLPNSHRTAMFSFSPAPIAKIYRGFCRVEPPWLVLRQAREVRETGIELTGVRFFPWVLRVLLGF